MRRFVCLLFILALFGCSKDSTDVILPSPQPSESLVCKDAAGFGPDITLTAPPSVRHQLKAFDGCFQHGECFYNCGKKP